MADALSDLAKRQNYDDQSQQGSVFDTGASNLPLFGGMLFGGVGATPREIVRLGDYHSMIRQGATPQEATQTTGWMPWEGTGKMFSEFSDAPAQFTDEMQHVMQNIEPGEYHGPTTLGEVFNHPEAYARYPALRDLAYTYYNPPKGQYLMTGEGAIGQGAHMGPVSMMDPNAPISQQEMDRYGMYMKHNIPSIYRALGAPDQPPMPTVLHEMSHAIAGPGGMEGFPGGGSLQSTDPQHVDEYWRNAGESMARATERRGHLKPKELLKPGNTLLDELNRQTPTGRQIMGDRPPVILPHDQPNFFGPDWEKLQPHEKLLFATHYKDALRKSGIAHPQQRPPPRSGLLGWLGRAYGDPAMGPSMPLPQSVTPQQVYPGQPPAGGTFGTHNILPEE